MLYNIVQYLRGIIELAEYEIIQQLIRVDIIFRGFIVKAQLRSNNNK